MDSVHRGPPGRGTLGSAAQGLEAPVRRCHCMRSWAGEVRCGADRRAVYAERRMPLSLKPVRAGAGAGRDSRNNGRS
ncbi:hypothetical protein SKAU_G00340990 [Synaphobranchus kaupii]|uniref:Uncharacterized protein n=1 Tax=Synaphobranchus kaupii TaxID=118154 RepID=A0A9Q1EN30_SYNKA|nr:hypothetical protein SKAU_G00340990 [Synaphobranchus kaupii]